MKNVANHIASKSKYLIDGVLQPTRDTLFILESLSIIKKIALYVPLFCVQNM